MSKRIKGVLTKNSKIKKMRKEEEWFDEKYREEKKKVRALRNGKRKEEMRKLEEDEKIIWGTV